MLPSVGQQLQLFGWGILNVNHLKLITICFSFVWFILLAFSHTVAVVHQEAVWPSEVDGVSDLHIIHVLRHFAPFRVVWVSVFVIDLIKKG